MRILHVFKDYYPPTRGGIENHIHDVVHSLDEFEFAVLTSSRSREQVVEVDDGVRVVRAAEYGRPTSTPITPGWTRLIGESGADLIHFHMPNPFGELMYLRARSEVPMIATYHADIVGRRALRPFYSPFQSEFLRRARKIIVSSPHLKETAAPLASHQEKTEVIPFGVEAAYWRETPTETSVIRGNHPGPIVLFLGRLAHYKGVEVLLKAMRSVQATLLVAGEGPLRPRLQALAVQAGVEGKTRFLGTIPDAMRRAYYHAAEVFVLPATSRAEAFGIAMLEAMACGTPAISTELGTGTSWVNQNGVTGLVVEPESPAALSAAIEALLTNEDRRLAMAASAARRAASEFPLSRMLESLAGVYREVTRT